MLHTNRTRAESFGALAELYDRARPSYPSELIDVLLAGGAQRVLDVGCGTGIAAAQVAARGRSVLGVEVDARMAAVARSRGIEVEVAPFERWEDRDRRFELVISAQAWHWVDPERGAARAARVLSDGGLFAAFWNVGDPPEHVSEAMAPVYSRVAPELEQDSLGGGRQRGRFQLTADGLAACGSFEPAIDSWFAHEETYDTAAWVDCLRTHSNHHTLPRERRESLLEGIAGAIDSIGGSFTMTHRTVLVSARRRPRAGVPAA